MEIPPTIQSTQQIDPAEQVAQALLYEGYMLYPYRPSSVKNRQRWNFGVLFPPSYCERLGGAESSTMQTECLMEGNSETVVSGKIRFLQHSSDETIDREVTTPEVRLGVLLERKTVVKFAFGNLHGLVELASLPVDEQTFKLTLRISNQSHFEGEDRDRALQSALLSTHTFLTVRNGAFHSMIDPPPALAAAKAQCRNNGTWPVLVGKEGDRDRILSAPIILYDYPKISPQSQGNLFDNTEIDEILTLRLRTLSDAEKLEVQALEKPVRKLLEQADSLGPQELMSLHGTLHRAPGGTCGFRKGDRVRLRPQRRADILDLALAGKTALVISVEQDFDDNTYVCVTVDDDPGKDFGNEGKPGHRFFFGLDEVEKL